MFVLFFILTFLLSIGSSLRLAQPPRMTKINNWRKFTYSGPVILNYHSLISNFSLIRCIATCSSLYNWDQIYYQEEDCYCLAPSYVEASRVSGWVKTNSESMVLYQDLFNCFVKGYTVFSDQGYCLKYHSTLVTFENAESQCRHDGGHLMSVYTPKDYDNLRSLYSRKTRIVLAK
ncbi:hypothetical protein LOTGIDRAFT_175930 [Lottia gigantea]|uniref:C-type lectin domain-containing protein n=1 Tax=Lottia gigantea TaxID=225164 RepID=V3ZYS0_LOTGI|nr:hypothetical protein LOTGIDRAFT_175930 [Lottia gigantea]ESO87785.1 hypothetical protein LOTGIDRAFT_175930 [Lottia gigantea]